MKKLILLALCVPMALILTQCKTTPKNEYTIKGKIETSGNPARAYLMHQVDGAMVTDSVEVVNNAFEFKGITEEPFEARIAVNYTPAEKMGRNADMLRMFVEPGKITLTSADSIKNAVITGSPINDEVKAYEAKFEGLKQENKELSIWYAGLTPEERGSEATKAKINEFSERSGETQKTIATEYMTANPGSWVALKMAYPAILGSSPDLEAAQAALDKFTPELKASKLGVEYQKQLDGLKATQVGQPAPDFTQNDVDGNPVKLSDFRGQYVLVDFWASWCGPCRGENPNVVAAYKQFKDKNFTVLGVSLDGTNGEEQGKAAWLKAIEDDKLEWKHVSDLKGWSNEAAKLYSVRSIPANFLINPEGIIIEKNLRGKDLISALEKHLVPAAK